MPQALSATEAAELLKATPRPVLLDVRRRSNLIAEGQLVGAAAAPGPVFSDRHLPEELTTPVLLVGASGDDAATEALAQRAETEWGQRAAVSWVRGGFAACREAGIATASDALPMPSVKVFYDKATGTCQFIVTDDETRDTLIIDSVLDFDPVSGVISHANANKILEFVRKHSLNVVRIVETHVHADHITAAQYLKEQLGGKPIVCIGEGIRTVQQTFKERLALEDLVPDGSQFDELLHDGATYKLGTLDARVLATPGHTSDSTSHVIGGACFVGDTVFQPDSGTARCDFPGGSAELLYASVQKLFGLPSHTQLFVGHDYQPGGRQLEVSATIEEQLSSNKHVHRGATKEEFVKARKERDATLSNPRLLFYALQANVFAGRLPPADAAGRRFFKVPITIQQ